MTNSANNTKKNFNCNLSFALVLNALPLIRRQAEDTKGPNYNDAKT